MKTDQKKKALTFGGFIADIYDTRGKRRAAKVVQFAVNEHFVVFPGRQRFVIS